MAGPWLALLTLVVLTIALWQNLDSVTSRGSAFHPDESRWLNRAHYLRDLLSPTSEVWEDRYLTRGQPPVGSYAIGLGLLLQGRDLSTNGPWIFEYGNEVNTTWNVTRGNMPARGDLLAARRTSALLGAVSCAAVCLIVASLTHWIGGLVGGLFLASHPLQVYLASIGVSDALFTCLVALSALAIVWLAARPSWSRAALLGVLLGLGAGAKLSPLFVAVALAGWGGLVLVDPWLRRRPTLGRFWMRLSRVPPTDPGARRIGWMLLALPAIATATFVASYPYLWPDPIARTRNLLDFRQAEMENQARIWPNTSIDSRIEAVERTWRTLQELYSTSGRALAWAGREVGGDWSGIAIDIPFALAGLALLAWAAWRRGIASRQALTLTLLGAQAGVIFVKLRIDFDRYYLPLVLVAAVGIGVLTSTVWEWVRTVIAQRTELTAPRPATPPRPRVPRTTARATARPPGIVDH